MACCHASATTEPEARRDDPAGRQCAGEHDACCHADAAADQTHAHHS